VKCFDVPCKDAPFVLSSQQHHHSVPDATGRGESFYDKEKAANV
jgi:hypothetical protein